MAILGQPAIACGRIGRGARCLFVADLAGSSGVCPGLDARCGVSRAAGSIGPAAASGHRQDSGETDHQDAEHEHHVPWRQLPAVVDGWLEGLRLFGCRLGLPVRIAHAP